MNLRAQVLLTGSLTLLLPALGWQAVRQLDASLREARVRAQELAAAELRADLLEGGRAVRAEAAPTTATGVARPDAASIDAVRVDAPPSIDGYADEWPVGARRLNLLPDDGFDTLVVRAAADAARLYLVVEGADAVPTWHRPPRPLPEAGELERPSDESRRANGDALELFLQTPDGRRRHAVLSPLAPGELAPLVASDGRGDAAPGRAGTALAGWRAAWQLRAGGWRAELAMPLPPAGSRLGLAAFDVEGAGGAVGARGVGDVGDVGRTRGAGSAGATGPRRWYGTLAPATMRALRRHPARPLPPAVPGLHLPDAAARAVLASRVPAGDRARLFDAAGRLLADIDRLNAGGDGTIDGPADLGLWDAVLFRAFAWTVAGDLPLPVERGPVREPLYLHETGGGFGASGQTRRYVTPERDRVLGTLVAVGTERLLYESNEEHSSAYDGSRLARIFSLLVLASLATTGLALGWAARLSFRIRALSRAAASAVDREGRVAVQSLPDARATDEIGDLSRDLRALLRRGAGYNAHLQGLAARLSHELGTPLAVVRGSLEHLEPHAMSAGDAALVERASDGARELAELLRALVESTRLEGMLERGERVTLDLETFARDCLERYRRAYPGLRLSLRAEVTGLARVVPEALVQALDKLVENAHRHAAADEVVLILEPLGRRPADRPPGRLARVLRRGAGRARRRSDVGAALLGVRSRAAPGDATRVASLLDAASGATPAGAPSTDAPSTGAPSTGAPSTGAPSAGSPSAADASAASAAGGLGLRVLDLVARLHGGRPIVRPDPRAAPRSDARSVERGDDGDWLTVGMALPLRRDGDVRARVASAYDGGPTEREAPG